MELPDENITNSRENNPIWAGSKPECRLEAVTGVDERVGWGSQAVCAGGGGNSLVHKVCKHFIRERLEQLFLPYLRMLMPR